MFNKVMLRPKSSRSETGFVSILVVTILSVVLALVAISFSTLMNRSLRSSLDRELSTQAYYSALSGVNDARAFLADCTTNNTTCDFSGCNNWPTPTGDKYFSSSLQFGNTAKYSCISVNAHPTYLSTSPLGAGQSVIYKLTQSQLGNLYFTWQNSQVYSGSLQKLGTNLGDLPKEGGPALGNNVTGLLRLTIYPIPNNTASGAGTCSNASDTNAALSCLSRNYFLYPSLNGTSGKVGTATYSSNGSFVPGNCNSANTSLNPLGNNAGAPEHYCNAAVTGLNSVPNANSYYIRLTAEYTSLSVGVQATNGSNSNPLTFDDSQAVVDVTGLGTDVQQRIRAKICISDTCGSQIYGLQSMEAICKGFTPQIASSTTYGAVSFSGGIGGGGVCAAPGDNGSIQSGGQNPHNGLPQPGGP